MAARDTSKNATRALGHRCRHSSPTTTHSAIRPAIGAIGIAICISDAVRRGGDCLSRYGGEEFAVLLLPGSRHGSTWSGRNVPAESSAMVRRPTANNRQHRCRERHAHCNNGVVDHECSRPRRSTQPRPTAVTSAVLDSPPKLSLVALEHDPEKWKPVFHATNAERVYAAGSCSKHQDNAGSLIQT